MCSVCSCYSFCSLVTPMLWCILFLSLFVFPLGINLSLHHIYCQLQSATIPANPNILTGYEPSMMADSRTVNLVPLTSSNYTTWKLQCQMALMREGLWSIVNATEIPPADGADDATKQKYEARKDRALATIVLSIDTSLLYLLGEPKDPVEVWGKLENQFQKKNWINKLILRRKLHTLHLDAGKSVQDHVKEMTEVFNGLTVIGAPLDDEDKVVHLLASLPESYDTLVTALEANEKVPTMEVVIDRLSYEERKVKERESGSGAKGLYHRTDHSQQRKGRQCIRCHYCKRLGHMQRDCRDKLEAERRRGDAVASAGSKRPSSVPLKSKQNQKHGASVGLIATHALLANGDDYSEKWILDSGATCHICCNQKLFDELEVKSSQDITLGDGRVIKSAGCGTVKVKLTQRDGSYRDCTLHDVLYVPDLSFNLLSIAKAAEYGKVLTFDDSSCNIISEGDVVGSATKDGSLYYLDSESYSLKQRVNTVKTRTGVNIWHRRYGHLGITSLKKLAKNKLVSGMSSDDLSDEVELCESCIKGKLHRTPFPSTTSRRAEDKLQVVHSDVCGKVNSKSLSGGEYFLTFVDDSTRYVWVYILKQKSEVFERFLEWKIMVEKSTGKKLQTLRTDNGGEYTSHKFEAYLKSEGVKHELTIPRTPEQNGVAERLNRTLMESVRSMLIGGQLPQRFWAEALATAVYIRNRSPTKIIEEVTPYEALLGVKPKVNHFRVFGCLAYAHICKEERRKLDPKATKCILLGYGTVVKGYRLYDIEERKVFFSRDVVFVESKTGIEQEQVTESEKLVNIELICDNLSDPEPTDAVDQEEVEQEEANHNAEDDEREEPPVLRRSIRERRPPDYYGAYVNVTMEDLSPEPTTVEEALASPEHKKWKEAMNKEIESLKANKVYDLVELPSNKKTVGCKWVFKRKINADGSIERYKARLVAQGFSQKAGEDYDETFCPVVRFESVRSIIALAAQHDLMLHQMDVTSAFLNGDLQEEIYLSQPKGFEVEDHNLVCKLNKSLYGLKQAPRCWNTALDSQLRKMGFIQSMSDPCLYTTSEGELFIIAVYVDDIILAGKEASKMNEVKQALSTKFEIKDMGELHYFLGVSVHRNLDNHSMWIGQPTYTASIIEKYGMKDAKAIATPVNTSIKLVKAKEGDELADMALYQSAVGSLQYLATMTRPDISFAVSNVGKFSSQPTKEHWIAVKRIIRYLKGTQDYGLLYKRDSTDVFVGYSDSDFGGDSDDRRSTSGYIFQIGGAGISWRSKKQTSVALSTAEAEYVALSHATQEAVWLRQLTSDLGCNTTQPTVIYEDNQAAICMAKNPTSKSKHIEIKYHYVREKVQDGIVEINYCKTEEMIADIMTKGLGKEKFLKLREMAGITQINK